MANGQRTQKKKKNSSLLRRSRANNSASSSRGLRAQRRGSACRRNGQGLAQFFGAGFSKATADSESTPVAAHVFSGRFFLGAVVLFFIFFAAYAPISTYIQQRAEISQVENHISQLKSDNDKLQTQLSWWQDDNYVKQQAKSRLYYVSEGETPYLVVGTDVTSTLADDTSAAAQTAPQDSWTTGLWRSFQEASEAKVPEDAGSHTVENPATGASSNVTVNPSSSAAPAASTDASPLASDPAASAQPEVSTPAH